MCMAVLFKSVSDHHNATRERLTAGTEEVVEGASVVVAVGVD